MHKGPPTVTITMRLRQATFERKRFIQLTVFGGWKSKVGLAAPLVWTLVKSEQQNMSQQWRQTWREKEVLRVDSGLVRSGFFPGNQPSGFQVRAPVKEDLSGASASLGASPSTDTITMRSTSTAYELLGAY